MGENTRLEDVTLSLTSASHHTLKGIVFPGTTSQTAKLRTAVLTVNNSAASTSETSNVIGVEFSGTGSLTSSSFSFNSVKGSTINVYSNGAGIKRGILVSNTNVASTRDTNVYVAKPREASSTGSYVGVETNDPNNTGSIQLRSTTVGVVTPAINMNESYTSSDILQTTPADISDPTYLASAGIQIGPGTDLVTKTAGSKGFSSYVYPTIVYYGLKGNIKDGAVSGYLWPGTQAVSNNFPDSTVPPNAAYFRIQQPSILSGLSASLTSGPSSSDKITILVKYTPVNGTIQDSVFTVEFTSIKPLTQNFYKGSLRLNTGDKIHVYIISTDNQTAGHDLTVQLDLF